MTLVYRPLLLLNSVIGRRVHASRAFVLFLIPSRCCDTLLLLSHIRSTSFFIPSLPFNPNQYGRSHHAAGLVFLKRLSRCATL